MKRPTLLRQLQTILNEYPDDELDLQLSVQSMSITTNVVSLNSIHDEVYSIQQYMIKFVSTFYVSVTMYEGVCTTLL
jgi:hypothetical protein